MNEHPYEHPYDDLKNHGGPAFPTPPSGYDFPGMTLCDWFAGQALIAVTATVETVKLAVAGARENDIDPSEYIARIAYQQADAMIAERERRVAATVTKGTQ